jgi:hypothetical protein
VRGGDEPTESSGRFASFHQERTLHPTVIQVVGCVADKDKIRLLGFTTLHDDTRRYAIPQCWGPHTQTQRHGVLAMMNYLSYLILSAWQRGVKQKSGRERGNLSSTRAAAAPLDAAG